MVECTSSAAAAFAMTYAGEVVPAGKLRCTSSCPMTESTGLVNPWSWRRPVFRCMVANASPVNTRVAATQIVRGRAAIIVPIRDQSPDSSWASMP